MPRIGLLAKPKSTPNRQCSTVLHPCHQEVPHKVWYIVFLTFGLAGRARVFRAVFSRDGAATRTAKSGYRGYRQLRSTWSRPRSEILRASCIYSSRSARFRLISSGAAESREFSLRGRVHGDRSYASGFESVLFIGRLLSTA